MIVDSDTNSIQRGGIAGEKVFGFVFSKKMYDLMSTNLYSDRIGSTVRETCSNAWDGHKAAGKENVPFNITLPTNLEPHFIVEDFGTGMPDDRAQELYSTLGLSTKEQSNDMIGAFGLGSKVPFTVTDSFSVENTYEGKTYFYLCFKNEKGFPSILKTGEVDTDRCNGVKIVIPVAGAKYNEFLNAMKRQLIMMSPKPLITNAGAFSFPEAKRLHELPSGFILEDASEFNLPGRTVYAKMGIVLYPIDLEQVGIRRGTRYHENFKYDSALILNFNIGDLDPVPSREGLTYDTAGKTIENINKKYDSYKEELLEKVTAEFKSETHTFTAWRMVLDTSSKLGINLAQSKSIVINGYTIGSTISQAKRFEYTHKDADTLDEAGTVVKIGRSYKMSDYRYKYDNRSRYSYGRKQRWDKDQSLTTIDYSQICEIVDGSVIYVLMDEKESKRKLIRMIELVEQNKGKEVRFVNISEHWDGDREDFSDFKKPYDDFYPGLSDKFISFKTVTAPKREQVKRDPDTFKGVKYYAPPYSSARDLKIEFVLDPETMFYVTAERDALIDYPNKTIKDIRDMGYEAGFTMILVRKGGVKALKGLQDEGILEMRAFVNKYMSDQTFSDMFKKKAASDIIHAEVIGKLSEVDNSVLKHCSKHFTTECLEYWNILVEANKIHEGFYSMTPAEKLLSHIQDNNFSELFKDEEWMGVMQSNFYERFVESRKKYMETYPHLLIVGRSTHTYPYYKTPIQAVQYVKDMNELAIHRASLDNLAGRLERLRTIRAVKMEPIAVPNVVITTTNDDNEVIENQSELENV